MKATSINTFPELRRFSQCKSDLIAERNRLEQAGRMNLVAHFDELIEASTPDAKYLPAVALLPLLPTEGY